MLEALAIIGCKIIIGVKAIIDSFSGYKELNPSRN